MATIVITGASSGVGFATARNLAGRGAHRIIAVARREARLDALRDACAASPGEIVALAADLSRADGVAAVAGYLASQELVLDGLVNNAGLLRHKPFAELDDADWQAHLEVNLLAPVRLIRALLPRFNRAPAAHVVNVSSMGGFQGSAKFAGLSAYSASKAALSNLTECLAEEFQPDGPRVNCIALGAVQTEMLAQAFPGYQAPIDAETFGEFLAAFALTGHRYCNGKILPMALTTP